MLLVISHLEHTDLFHAMQVSSQWYHMVNQPLIWERVFRRYVLLVGLITSSSDLCSATMQRWGSKSLFRGVACVSRLESNFCW